MVKISLWLIYGTLKDNINPGWSGPENNDDDGVLNIYQSSGTEDSPSEGVVS